MTEKQRTHLRADILKVLYNSSPFSITEDDVHFAVRLDGFGELTPKELTIECDALREMSFVERDKQSPLNATIKRWKLTEAGRVWLVENNLIP